MEITWEFCAVRVSTETEFSRPSILISKYRGNAFTKGELDGLKPFRKCGMTLSFKSDFICNLY
jgi:hypothetical protein